MTNKLPASNLKRDAFEFPRNLKLADPQFHRSLEIDLLIGAGLFWDILCVGQIKASFKHPVLQKTRLGWVLAGRLSDSFKPVQRIQAFHAKVSNAQLHEQLGLFWNQEGVENTSNNLTLDEAQCKQHFQDYVSRTPQGRFVVGLPFKEQVINELGDSSEIALKRFFNLERRFKRDPILKDQYSRFINEYLSLGHMRRMDVPPSENSPSFYLPHHCVYKDSDQGSKIRVVFDASCKSSSGLSLNDA